LVVEVRAMFIGAPIAWAVAASASAEEPASEAGRRARDLLAGTADMTADQRATYVQALIDARREPQAVEDALLRALAAAREGLSYEETVALAVGTVPADRQAPTDATTPPPPVGSTPGTQGTDDRALEAMRRYRLEHLSVRTETHVSGGGTNILTNPYVLGGVIVTQDPILTERTWGVYQGPVRMEVPTYLGIAGLTDEKHDLDQRISSKRWLSRTYYGVAGLGVAAVIAGSIGHAASDGSAEHDWGTVATMGLGGVVVGLIGGSLPAASVARLKTDYSRTTDIAEAQRTCDAHNEALRTELGLTPDQALQVEDQARH
jgi:hypothetical protein